MTRFIPLLIALFCTTTLLAQNNENGDVELESYVLDECVVDQPFDTRLIEKTYAFGGNGYKWFITKYKHSYLLKRKMLIVGLSSNDTIYEKEIETRKFMSQSFSYKADYFEKDEHNNFLSMTNRLTSGVTRYLIGREAMQCE